MSTTNGDGFKGTGADDAIVIIGAGLAGVEAAAALRDSGYAGRVTLIGDERGVPYQRPPLSKDFFAGGDTKEIRPADFFSRIDFRQGRRAVAIDRRTRTVALDDGTHVAYSRLVMATGSRNKMLGIPGEKADGVHWLRTDSDAESLAHRLKSGGSVIVVGAGFIGLEFAAAARTAGLEVTVLEYAERSMSRVVSPAISDYFAAAHRRAGCVFRFGEGVAEISDSNRPTVTTSAGNELDADFVVMGAGAVADTELAQSAELSVAPGVGGVLVDEYLATEDPYVFAAGDCANFPTRYAAGDSGTATPRIRLESEQNATDQGRYVGRRLAAIQQGREPEGPYGDVPWFWSHQAEEKLYIAGIPSSVDERVVRGDPASGSFSVFGFRDGRLAAVESVNKPADHVAARKVLAAGWSIEPGQAADPEFDFKAVGKAARKAARSADPA